MRKCALWGAFFADCQRGVTDRLAAKPQPFISALRAAFGGCAPKRACGRSPGEKVDSKTAGTGGFEDGSGMREIT